MSDKKSMGLRVINMSFSTEKPIIGCSNKYDWVTWGVDNNWPQYLLNLFHNYSITHKQIILRKVKMISGSGIDIPKNASKTYMEFIENKWGDMNIEDMSIKMSYDLVLFNGVSLNPHLNVDNTSLTKLCYVPFERVRQDSGNGDVDKKGLPQYMWISNDWLNFRKDENEPKQMVKFDENIDAKSQLYYYMNIDQGIKWYPDVEYSPAINYIDADYEIGNYHNNSIKNGFHAGFMLNFATGIPTEDEMDRAYEDIEEKFVGTNNANKFLLGWSNGADGAPTLIPIPTNNSDTKYLELEELIRNKIMEAHEVVNPLIFGVPTPGTLGGRTEILEALAVYQSTYVNGKQKVIEDILNKFAKLYGVDIEKEPIKLKKYSIDIPEIEGKPILSLSDIITLTGSIKSGQLDIDTALNILDTVYGMNVDKAKKLLQAPVSIQKITPQ